MTDDFSAGDNGSRSWSDLGPRLISAAILLVVTIFMVWMGGLWFALIVSVVFAGMLREWEIMITTRPVSRLGYVLIAVMALVPLSAHFGGFRMGTVIAILGVAITLLGDAETRWWRTMGFLFFAAVSIALMAVRGESTYGFAACFFLGTTIWMTDTGAFFIGRQLGGAKLNPDISPAKTWSGALGGLFTGTLAGLLIWVLTTPSPLWIGLVIAAAVSIAGQLGDLTESAIKRNFQIKDTSDVIPGHGGLMDRLDSLTFGALLVFAIGAVHLNLYWVAAGLMLW